MPHASTTTTPFTRSFGPCKRPASPLFWAATLLLRERARDTQGRGGHFLLVIPKPKDSAKSTRSITSFSNLENYSRGIYFSLTPSDMSLFVSPGTSLHSSSCSRAQDVMEGGAGPSSRCRRPRFFFSSPSSSLGGWPSGFPGPVALRSTSPWSISRPPGSSLPPASRTASRPRW